MKQVYFLFTFLFVFSFSQAQIGFEKNLVFDSSYFVDVPLSIESADLDGDGDIDLVTASVNDDRITWFENIDGQGTFVPRLITDDAYMAQAVFPADIDGDGDMDVVYTARIGGKLFWSENTDGLGNFGTPQLIVEGLDYISPLVVKDLNGDSDLDIIVGLGIQDMIVWFENLDGLGQYGTPQTITTTADNVSSIYSVDVDNDGDNDVLAATEINDKIVWYENTDGQGTFGTEEVITTTADFAKSVYAADLDNDGDFDVLSASKNDNKVAWYENLDGQGTFGAEQIVDSNAVGAFSVYTKDIDGDGDMDILSAGNFADSIFWYENLDGLGTFGSQQTITTLTDGVYSVRANDLDGDGDMDVFSVSGADDKVAWYENTDGLGAFGGQNLIALSNAYPVSLFATDIDNDGDNDILAALSQIDKIVLYENTDGQGQFGLPITITENVDGVTSVYSADMDGDGDMDVLSASWNDDKIVWIENTDGLGAFGTQNIITTSTNGANCVYAADIDGDGDMDVLSSSNNDNKIAWYENLDGLGGFGTPQIINSSLYRARGVIAKDIDGDGDLDVICHNNSGASRIIWHENLDGLGDFSAEQSIGDSIFYVNSFFLTDIDNDNDLDVFFASSYEVTDGVLGWYENLDGLGNFGAQQIIVSNDFSTSEVYASDLDNDGDMDIIKGRGTATNSLSWFENLDGQGTFAAENVVGYSSHFNSLHASDINNDGKQDIIAGFGNTEVAWYKNLGLNSNEINGYVRVDMDSNGCDESDIGASSVMINTNNGSENLSTFSIINGAYQLLPNGEGEYTTSVVLLPDYYSVTPASHTSNFTGIGNEESLDFCLEPTAVVDDLNIAVYPLSNPRPGSLVPYLVVYKNIGTTQLSGNIIFEYNNNKIVFLNSSQTLTSQSSNSLTFDFMDLNPFETRTIYLEFNAFTPPTTDIGDILATTVTINPVSGDYTAEDNVLYLEEEVIGSYDPNDIQVLEGDEILLEDADKYLHYIIRFQNTGTANAINIRVNNVLDSKLDWTTMQLESLSHAGRVEITNNTNVDFIFDGIYLPDSTSDEPNSHGYIAYKIKPKNDVQLGDIFYNSADIYFDFNPAITTNTASTEIVETLSVDEYGNNTIKVYPNPTKDKLTISTTGLIQNISITDINGRIVLKQDGSNNSNLELDLSSLSKGMYFVNIQTDSGSETVKVVKQVLNILEK